MKLSVCGYSLNKEGTSAYVYAINPVPITNGAGYRPFYVNRNGRTDIGLWIPISDTFRPTKDLINKMINVEFGPSGRVLSAEIVK